MLQLGYIEIDYMSAGHLKVTPLGRKVLFGEQQALMTIYQKTKDFALPTKKGGYKYRPIRPIESASVDETLLDSLQQLRKQIAEREHTPGLISSLRMTPSRDYGPEETGHARRVQRNTRCRTAQAGQIRKDIRRPDPFCPSFT